MPLVACVVVGMLCLTVTPAAAEKVTIKRTEGGIPNVTARSFHAAGYGYGYAFAEDNICEMADTYVTVSADRAKFFDPEESEVNLANDAVIQNLDSDFFFQRIIDTRAVEKLLAQPPPVGPVPGVKKLMRGYVGGYNAYLRETGVDHLPDPSCRGEEWVRPIDKLDAYRRLYQLSLLASQGVAIEGIANASPPTPAVSSRQPSAAERDAMLSQLADRLPLGNLGSNGYGLGSEATRNRRGMVLANPHFPWDGPERLYQAHLRVPGKLNVSGASLFGVPTTLVGHTRKLAWTHTVSTAYRFTPFELRLVPGLPTTYLVDGQLKQMTSDEVTVDVRQPDGSVAEETRTLWNTEYGPVLTSILGLPVFPWTPTTAYAIGDVNAENLRFMNHFFKTNRAQSTKALFKILKRYQGIPWVNTIAADRRGRALYADIGAIPAVPDSKAQSCNTPLGVAATELLGLPVLDGSRSACNWDSDPDAVVPGTFGPSNEPHLFRDDYVSNSNESYWLANPEHPLEGFARIIGDERTPRPLRTRMGLVMVRERIEGIDGLEGTRFTLRKLQTVMLNNRNMAGELWREELVEMCEQNPMLLSSSGASVDVSEACPILATWGGRQDRDSRGALLFRRFASRVLASPLPVGGPPVSPYDTPFDPSDPVDTPRGLDTDEPTVRAAFADAVQDLRGAGIPLDAPVSEHMYELRGDERIPMHGGPHGSGTYNYVDAPWNGSGFDDVFYGTSFIMATSITAGCPDDRSILAYSQSTNPRSPYFADQTRMFSDKEWIDPPFCTGEVRAADPVAKVRRLNVRR